MGADDAVFTEEPSCDQLVPSEETQKLVAVEDPDVSILTRTHPDCPSWKGVTEEDETCMGELGDRDDDQRADREPSEARTRA
jgi:hypothetical protein